MPLNVLAPVGSPDSLCMDLVDHFGVLAFGGVGPQRYMDFVEQNKSLWSREFVNLQRELAAVYSTFVSLKEKEGVLGFNDLISNATELLAKFPHVSFIQQYKYLQVDEFQDLSPILLRFLLQLTKSIGHSNVLALGDDDQGIYSFRSGCSPLSNFSQFSKSFPDAHLYILCDNFRNSPEIVQVSQRLISHNLERLPLHETKKMNSLGRTSPSWGPKRPVFLECGTDDEELKMIADTITRMCQVHEELSFGDFAVLARRNSGAQWISEGLTRLGLPVDALSSSKLTSIPEVTMLMSFLSIVCSEVTGDRDLLHLASSEAYRGIDLRRIGSGMNIAQKIVSMKDNDKVAAELIEDIKSFRTRVLGGQSIGTRLLVVEFLKKRGLFDKLVSPDSALSELRASRIFQFLKHIDKVEYSLDTTHAPSVVRHLHSLLVFGEKLSLDSDSFAGFNSESRPLLPGSDLSDSYLDIGDKSPAVAVTTMHRAKGLEFEFVFLPRLVENEIPGNYFNRGFPIPEGISDFLRKKTRDAQFEEERRLLYVSLTRAKSHVIMSSAKVYGGSKPGLKPSRFIDECLGENATIEAPEIITELPPVSEMLKLKVSHSKMDTYEKCPMRYHFQYVLKIPQPPTVPLVRGSAYHEGIASLAKNLMKAKPLHEFSEPVRMSLLKSMQDSFRSKWAPEVFSEEREAERAMKHCFLKLSEFMDRDLSRFQKGEIVPLHVEKNFSVVMDDDADTEVRGIFDRIDLEFPDTQKESIVIREFKTRLNPWTEQSGRTQLSLYAFAHHELFGTIPSVLRLEDIESGKTIDFGASDSDVKSAKTRVARFVASVRALKFDPAPAVSKCSVCPFNLQCTYAAVKPPPVETET
jgi:superfamily I DNA/RNA helicase